MIKDQILLEKAKERRNKINVTSGDSNAVLSVKDGNLPRKEGGCIGHNPPAKHVACADGTSAIARAYEIISDIEELPPYDTIAIDTETTGLQRDAKLLGASFCGEAGKAYWLPSDKIVPFIMEAILADKLLIMHNAKFDLQVLNRNDVSLFVFQNLIR